jgi:hypothetical protein
MGKTYDAYTYHILFRLQDTYMIINLSCTIEKKVVLLYIHKYSMLGAIQLAVVANKFNLQLNKCWNRCARGQPVLDLLSCMIRIRISTSLLRPMSSRQL